ncbi:membrane protein [Bacillus sp. JCM 19045]|nr:membrane protein [Bacillus sp. JCM 19045]
MHWSSLVAVAGVAKVNVQQLVRLCFIPVVIGLLISTLAALLLW